MLVYVISDYCTVRVMSEREKFIDWTDVGKTNAERVEEFYADLHDLIMFNLDDIEFTGTLVWADPNTRKEWELIGRGYHKDPEEAVRNTEKELAEALEPIIGIEVNVATNYVCREQKDGKFVETVEEYSPVYIKGKIRGIKSVIAEVEDNYPIGFGDHVPGPYPKTGIFEQYRICLQIDDALIPVRTIDGSWNWIKAVE